MSDDKTREAQMARIRALMARTTKNGCTEAEAEAAAAAVDRLMALYEIDLDDVAVRNQEVVKMDIEALTHSVRFMATSIAAFCDCEVWADHPNIVYLGLEIDTEIAEYLTMLMMRAIDRETSNFTMFNPDYAMRDGVGQSEMVLSFTAGLCARLSERLRNMKSGRDFSQKTSGFDLVIAKGALIGQAMTILGITLTGATAGRTIRDTGAYHAGRKAGDNVSISQGVGRNATTSTAALR